jgi:TPR repeat protein
MFYDGNGVKKDGLAALTWWRKAAAQNEWLSQYNLGLAYHHGEDVPQDYSQAFQWYEKAATKGFAPAQFHL